MKKQVTICAHFVHLEKDRCINCEEIEAWVKGAHNQAIEDAARVAWDKVLCEHEDFQISWNEAWKEIAQEIRKLKR